LRNVRRRSRRGGTHVGPAHVVNSDLSSIPSSQACDNTALFTADARLLTAGATEATPQQSSYPKDSDHRASLLAVTNTEDHRCDTAGKPPHHSPLAAADIQDHRRDVASIRVNRPRRWRFTRAASPGLLQALYHVPRSKAKPPETPAAHYLSLTKLNTPHRPPGKISANRARHAPLPTGSTANSRTEVERQKRRNRRLQQHTTCTSSFLPHRVCPQSSRDSGSAKPSRRAFPPP
jgi:hypothetical protein